MLVLDDGFLAGQQRSNDDVLNFLKQPVDCWEPVLARQKQFELFYLHFASYPFHVLIPLLLHRDIGQMHLQIVRVFSCRRVSGSRESRKAAAVQPNHERRKRCHERIQSHIELLASNNVWISQVPLNDIRIGSRSLS